MYYVLKSKKTITTAILAILASAGFVVYGPYTPVEVSALQLTDERLATHGSTGQNPAPSETPSDSTAVDITRKGCFLNLALNYADGYYTVTVANIGDSSCKEVAYSIYYSPTEKYISATPPPTASNYYWSIGELKSGKTAGVRKVFVSGSSEGTEVCVSATGAQDKCIVAKAYQSGSTTPPAQPPTSTPPGDFVPVKEYGVWVWDSPVVLGAASEDRLTSIKNSGFNTVYVTVDDYLKSSDKASYLKKVNEFMVIANKKGLKVYAEMGWRDWAKPENRKNALTLIEMVSTYNKKYPKAKIYGVQHDTEPYLLPEYEDNKEIVLTDFVGFVDVVSKAATAGGLVSQVVVPHFYGGNDWTPDITYLGKKAKTFDHVLSLLDSKGNNNSIVIMSYRTTFEGNEGVDIITRYEVEKAGTTKVIVAQETGNVEPSYVTFYGKKKGDLFSQLKTIQAAYSGYAGFGGTAVHYLEPFVALPD